MEARTVNIYNIIYYNQKKNRLKYIAPERVKNTNFSITYIAFVFRWVDRIAKQRLLASPCTSVRQHVRNRLPLDGFSRILNIFRKHVEKIQVSLKSDYNNGYFTWRPIYIFYHISLNFFTMWNLSHKFVEEIKTHFVFSKFFSENLTLYVIMWKIFFKAGQATDDNMAHAHCMLDN
jgi:hypothetical protein